MHAKHRDLPGNGFRGNVMGISGIAGSSRTPSEGQIRGHRMYNRGAYGRGGHSKHFKHQIHPLREANILIEAGRLAAEYLVSKELLSPAALSGKYSDAMGGQFGNFEIRSQKEEISDGRLSVHSRLGNAVSDQGQGRRRYSDDYTSLGSRSSMKERKRAESLKGKEGAEVNRDLMRSESLTKNSKTSPFIEGNTNAFDEQPTVEDVSSGVHSSSFGETNEEVDNEIHFNSGFVKLNKDSSLSTEVPEGQQTNDVDKIGGNKEATKGLGGNDLSQKFDKNEEVKGFSREIDVLSIAHVDLLKHCKFVSFPTKPRSSMKIKCSRSNQHSTNEDKNVSERETLEDSSVHFMDTGSSVCNDSSNKKHDSECLHLNGTDTTPSPENNVDLHHLKEPCESSRSRSKEMERDDSISSFGTSNSTPIECGKKRTVDSDADGIEDLKKIRQSDYISQTTSVENLPISIVSCEEKGLEFDLNLNENQQADSVLTLPSSNTCNLPITDDKQGISENSIEVIDLEKGDTFRNTDGREEALFTGLDGFSNNANGISDGFGLMISEFLENNSPNCSSVPTDLNYLHNQVFLPNNEEILADDDSIYMSLGEIPIGFLRDLGKPF